MKYILKSLFVALPVLFIVPLFQIASADGITNLGTLITSITNNVVKALATLFATAALVAFFFGIVKYIWGIRDGVAAEIKKGQDFMIWSLIALFVMFSVWGIVQYVQNIFDIKGQNTITIPTIQFNGTGATNPTNPLIPNPSGTPNVTNPTIPGGTTGGACANGGTGSCTLANGQTGTCGNNGGGTWGCYANSTPSNPQAGSGCSYANQSCVVGGENGACAVGPNGLFCDAGRTPAATPPNTDGCVTVDQVCNSQGSNGTCQRGTNNALFCSTN